MSERQIHIPILVWIKKHAPQCIVFHCPNGGSRNRIEAIRLKELGTLPGVPDLTIIPPNGVAHFLEVKKEKGGRISTAQTAFMRRAHENGCHGAIVRSVEEVKEAFAEWGIATK